MSIHTYQHKERRELFEDLLKGNNVSPHVIRRLIGAKLDTVVRFLNFHADGNTDPVSGAAVTATIAHLMLAASDVVDIRVAYSVCFMAKKQHSGITASVLLDPDARRFKIIDEGKEDENAKASAKTKICRDTFYLLNDNLTFNIDDLLDDKTISKWSVGYMTGSIMKPEPNPAKVFSALKESLDETETDMGNGLLYRGAEASRGQDIKMGIIEISLYCTMYFKTLCVACSIRIGPKSKAGKSGFIGKVRYAATWKSVGGLCNTFINALRDLTPLSRWKQLLLDTHKYINVERMRVGNVHMNDICDMLVKDRQFFNGVESEAERKARSNIRDRPQLDADGQPVVKKQQVKNTGAKAPCVPHFLKNETCKAPPGQCRFSHSGQGPSQDQITRYYNGTKNVAGGKGAGRPNQHNQQHQQHQQQQQPQHQQQQMQQYAPPVYQQPYIPQFYPPAGFPPIMGPQQPPGQRPPRAGQ